MFILSCYLIVKFTAPGTEVEPFLFGKKEEGQIWLNSEMSHSYGLLLFVVHNQFQLHFEN